MSDISKKGILLASGTNEAEFLVFQLANQAYGINVSKVQQLIKFDHNGYSPIPNQLPELLGVMQFRDSAISLIDLRIRFKHTSGGNHETPPLLIVTEFNQRKVAFVVDAVDTIQRISWNNFEPISDTACNTSQAEILGIIRQPGKLILIPDFETMMSEIDPSMSVERYDDIAPTDLYDRTKVRIVSCDDSAIVQKVLQKALAESGFKNLLTFSSAVDALKFLSDSGGKEVDVIISDVEMPQLDGLSFCKKLKEYPPLSSIPVIFFSSTVNQAMRSKCLSVGGSAAFSKPEIHLVVKEIDSLVAGSKS